MTHTPPARLAVLSFSGGMDSTTLVAHMIRQGYTPLLLSVDYGQRHRRELDAARAVASYYNAEHRVVDATSIGALLTGSALTSPDTDVPEGHYAADNMSKTVVPNRNAILANIAVGWAVARRAEVVALGVHAGDHAVYPDCRPEFVDSLRMTVQAATAGYHTPRIVAPFVRNTKAEIAFMGAKLNTPFELTWSCYKGGAVHCGKCGTCVERAEAFAEAKVPDPTEYADANYWRTAVGA